jgi:hypothetical protein
LAAEAPIFRLSLVIHLFHRRSRRLGHQVLPDMERRRTKIDEESGFDSRRTKIFQELGNMLIGDCAGRLQFNNECILNEQIREVLAQESSVFIENVERMLLPEGQSLFSKPVAKRILIYFFRMAVPVIAMDGETGLANNVAELIDGCEFHAP